MKKTLVQRMSESFVKRLVKEGIPQVEIAVFLKLSAGQVSRIYKGEKFFTLDAIVEISNHYRISMGDLLAKNIYKKTDREIIDLFIEAEKISFELDEIIDKKNNKKAI